MPHQRNPSEGSPQRNEPVLRFHFLPRPVQGHDEFHFAVLSPQAAKRAEQFSNGAPAILRSRRILGLHHPESEFEPETCAHMNTCEHCVIGIVRKVSTASVRPHEQNQRTFDFPELESSPPFPLSPFRGLLESTSTVGGKPFSCRQTSNQSGTCSRRIQPLARTP